MGVFALKKQKILYNSELSGYIVEQSKLFCYPTNLLDTWKSKMQVSDLKSFNIFGSSAEIITYEGVTKTFSSLHLKNNLSIYSTLKKRGKSIYENSLNTIYVNDGYIYDARKTDNDNIAHLIQHHLTKLNYIHLNSSILVDDITIILRKNSSRLSYNFFMELGYKIISSNSKIYGQSIEVVCDNFYLLLPFLSLYEIHNYISNTHPKIFLSRKDSRRIVNELEIEKYLLNEGFKKLYLEELPFSLQW